MGKNKWINFILIYHGNLGAFNLKKKILLEIIIIFESKRKNLRQFSHLVIYVQNTKIYARHTKRYYF
jgi:hypothetical protein